MNWTDLRARIAGIPNPGFRRLYDQADFDGAAWTIAGKRPGYKRNIDFIIRLRTPTNFALSPSHAVLFIDFYSRVIRADGSAERLREIMGGVVEDGDDPLLHRASLARLRESPERMPGLVFAALLQVVCLQEQLNYPGAGAKGRRKPLEYLDALLAGTELSRVIAAAPVGRSAVNKPIWTGIYVTR